MMQHMQVKAMVDRGDHGCHPLPNALCAALCHTIRGVTGWAPPAGLSAAAYPHAWLVIAQLKRGQMRVLPIVNHCMVHQPQSLSSAARVGIGPTTATAACTSEANKQCQQRMQKQAANKGESFKSTQTLRHAGTGNTTCRDTCQHGYGTYFAVAHALDASCSTEC